MLPDGDHAPTSLVSGNPFHLPAWMCHRHLRLPVLTQLPSLFLLLLVTLSRSLRGGKGPALPRPQAACQARFPSATVGVSHVRGGWLSASQAPSPT